MSARFGIVADDLTGAADAGARFARAGLAVDVVLGDRVDPAAQVIVLDTASRAMAPDDAAAAAAAARRRLLELGVESVFKKLDSTLRGNPGAEIGALLSDDAPHSWALMCPAFPEQGRVVVDGRVRVNGHALGPDVVATLGRGIAVSRLDRGALEAGPAGIAEWLAAAVAAGTEVVVADAASPSDLALLVDGAAALATPPLYAGSAGLAGVVARRWAATIAPTVVAVIGSLEPVTRAQARALGAQAGWLTMEIDRETLVADEQTWRAWIRRAAAASPSGGVVLLSPPDPGLERDRVAARLGEAGAELVRGLRPAGLVATGGDTAAAVLGALAGERFRIERELEPGLPLARLAGGDAHGLAVVLKSGAFGDEASLVRAVGALTGAAR